MNKMNDIGSALSVQNLNKNYGSFQLKDVSFEVPKGYIMGFIGPNGAGKTTTVKAIMNMIRYESGEIRIFGKDSKDQNARINEQIGVVLDNPLFVDDWTMVDVEKAVKVFRFS